MACSRIKCGEQLVLHQYLSPGKCVEEGRFASIGIANNRHHRNGLRGTMLTMQHTLLAHSFDLFLQLCNTTANAAAVNLQLCFTRTAYADGSPDTSCSCGSPDAPRSCTARAATQPREFYAPPA